jgi:hypothetical protein
VQAGNVVWKDFVADGRQYSIAAGPRGTLLWTQGNAGTDIPSALIFAVWDRIMRSASRRLVVKVRRRGFARLRYQVLRRVFPASNDLLECAKSVEREFCGP